MLTPKPVPRPHPAPSLVKTPTPCSLEGVSSKVITASRFKASSSCGAAGLTYLAWPPAQGRWDAAGGGQAPPLPLLPLRNCCLLAHLPSPLLCLEIGMGIGEAVLPKQEKRALTKRAWKSCLHSNGRDHPLACLCLSPLGPQAQIL